jgi:catechol 2,3-dioxygenase-like lactoylglutathione lyase family enzyme
MTAKGFSHIGLSTLDLDATRAFYENVLGFTAVRGDILEVKEGGRIRHVFFDLGNGQMLAFMEPRGIPGLPAEYDAGINRGLGVPDAFYHFAFDVESHEALVAKRQALLAKGVKVSPIVDHDGWMESIYFKDPNGIMLEFAWQARALDASDVPLAVRARISLRERSAVTDFRSE